MLRFLTAGESHGPTLVGIIEGLPAGLEIDEKIINVDLSRRQKSYGRGNRMKKIEKDKVVILGGLRNGITIGSPLALQIENKDWAIRKNRKAQKKSIPRPGHADLAGAVKYRFSDIQNVIERSSARETAMRTAIGSVAKIFLAEFGIEVFSHVIRIGKVKTPKCNLKIDQIKNEITKSPVYCFDNKTSKKMCQEIDKAKDKGDTLGGVFEVVAVNLPIGLGSYVHYDRKLEGKLAQMIMSIPSVKAFEIGDGVINASRYGSKVHDEIIQKDDVITHSTNRAGGLEGGMTNGEPLILRGFVKPISSLRDPLKSVDLKKKTATRAPYVRSDVCVVPAAGVIGETLTAWTIAESFLEKFGGDSMDEIRTNYNNRTTV
ncbi:MAG: chorismate synthase [candidate division Zixibacteria bacterium]|nr:chorismate synthase [candidate division Zixibacteria bacterium]